MLNKSLINLKALLLSILLTINIYFGVLSYFNPLSYWGNIMSYGGLQRPSIGFFPLSTVMLFSSIVVWGVSYIIIRLLQGAINAGEGTKKVAYLGITIVLVLTIVSKLIPIQTTCVTNWAYLQNKTTKEKLVEIFFKKECPNTGSTNIELMPEPNNGDLKIKQFY